ncbi:MAG: ProQ/FinO family protein, partial [Rhodoferax sp.]
MTQSHTENHGDAVPEMPEMPEAAASDAPPASAPPVGGPAAPSPDAAATAAARKSKTEVFALLDTLARLYPQLFGAVFLPLKRGIFQDLLAAHPDIFARDSLKSALAFHTRSTRYLSAVAAGQSRHDLHGQAVEDTAPAHIHQALLEVFRRRQTRNADDLRPKLVERIAQAFEASGLSAQVYTECVGGHDEAALAVLQEAL